MTNKADAVHFSISENRDVFVNGTYNNHLFSAKFVYINEFKKDSFGNKVYALRMVEFGFKRNNYVNEELKISSLDTSEYERYNFELSNSDGWKSYEYWLSQAFIFIGETVKPKGLKNKLFGINRVRFMSEEERYKELARATFYTAKREIDNRCDFSDYLNNIGTIKVTVEFNND